MQTQETIRIEYRLPADMHNQFEGWQRREVTHFPDDRQYQEQRNQAAFAAKAKAGLIKRRVLSAVLLVVGLSFSAPAVAQTVDHAAEYNKAVACLPSGTAPALRLEEIKFVVVPGAEIHVPRGNDIQHSVLRAAFTPGDSTIWIAEPYANMEWIVVHELLHAVGVRGHPASFRRCRLLESQQPKGWRK